MTFSRNKKQGMSLVSAVVALGIGGILFATINSMALTAIKSAKHVQQIGEVEDIRNTIRARLDCDVTQEMSSKSEKNIILYDRNSRPLFNLESLSKSSKNSNSVLNSRISTMKLKGWTITVEPSTGTKNQFQVDAENGDKKYRDIFKHGAPLTCPSS